MTDDSLSKVERTVGAVAKIIEVTKDSPEARQAASNLGKTAVTLTSALNNCLLPIAAINYGIDKARRYFEENFSKDLAEKTADIPDENLIEPKASLASSIINRLAFSHDEIDLKEMYLNLLASSMDSEKMKNAHPAFVEIINQLSADEARVWQGVAKSLHMPIIEIRQKNVSNRTWNTVKSHVMQYVELSTGEPVVEPNLELWVNNWIRLGMCSVDYDKTLAATGAYEWAESRPEYLQYLNDNKDVDEKIEIQHGVLRVTELGRVFSIAVAIR